MFLDYLLELLMINMITRILFGLLFVHFNCFSQEIRIMSHAMNIPYATLTYHKGNTVVGGTYTNDKGVANVPIDKNIDKISISHLSYVSKTIKAIKNDTVINLDDKTQDLAVVNISKSGANTILIGNELARKNIFISSGKGIQFANLIEGNQNLEGSKLKNVTFNIKRSSEKNAVLLRISFYENNIGVPANIIVSTNDILAKIQAKKKGKISINVENENIYFPANGLFVVIECVGLVDKNNVLIENKSFTDSGLGFNLTDNPQKTFCRNKFYRAQWDDFSKNDIVKNKYLEFACELEIH